MLFSRLITFFLALFCLGLAYALGEKILLIPLKELHWVTWFAALFFGTSAAAMFIGLFGLQRTSGGLILKNTGLLRRWLNFVAGERIAKGNAHCCDLYLATSFNLFLACVIAFAISLVVGFAWNTPGLALIIVGAIAAILVGVPLVMTAALAFYDWCMSNLEKYAKKTTWLKKLFSWKRRLGEFFEEHFWLAEVAFVCFVVLFCLSLAGCIVYLMAVLPVNALALLGMSYGVAIGIYLASVSVIALPFLCIGGKKLLHRYGGKFATKVCPIVNPRS